MVIGRTRRFNVIACGRRWGKTTLGILRLSKTLLDGGPAGWFAPNYKYLTEAWRDFNRVLRPVINVSNASEKRVELITGGSLDFWTLEDPDSGRSRKYQRVVIDEAAKARYLERAWNEAIRPTLTDLEGDADFYSTPKGLDFFWRGFTWGQEFKDDEWSSWRMPTSVNPHIKTTEIDAAQRQLPDRVFRQEYLAEFIEDAGGVFRGVLESIDKDRKSNAPEPGRSYTLGVDLARIADFTVLTVMDGTGKQVYHERFNQISWERQISTIHAIASRYNATVVLDSTGLGDPIYERIRQSGAIVEPYQMTSASKERLIDFLAMQMEQGKVRLLDVPEQTNELRAFQYELSPSRNVKMSAPEGMHDDIVISLALATWGALGACTYSAGAF